MISIGMNQVGRGQKPFIIAEVGSNFTCFDDCKDSIAKAKACGADAVKFQAFDRKSLYGSQGEMPGSLPMDWIPRLSLKAKACGIEFMCSAFSPELVEAVNPYTNVHKVASAELTHLRILEKVRSLGKPVILSTGASGESDIRGALEVLSGVPVILLYCVAAYPARVIDLGVIAQMERTFGVPVGFSDHSESATVIPQRAAELGACVIEKHVNFVGATSPDSPHSLSTDEFKLMVETIHGTVSRGMGPTQEENGMIRRHNRRILAIRDIPLGEALQEGVNFGIYRSLIDDATAAHPFAIHGMIGRGVRRAIKAGQGIAMSDVI